MGGFVRYSFLTNRVIVLYLAMAGCTTMHSATLPEEVIAPPSRPSSDVPLAPSSAQAAQAVASAAVAPGSAEPPAPAAPPACASFRDGEPDRTLEEPGGPARTFSFHGYVARSLRIERDGATPHCVTVAWPPGARNSDGKPVSVAARLDVGWLRGIENTLQRLPPRHLRVVKRIVIDDRPTEHGIAPFDRRTAGDARDGHTVWLHERLFTEPNHWANGNHGRYWSYHVDRDGQVLDDQPDGHDRFSPVLLHELGHLVAYSVVNGDPSNESVPPCARVCGDRGGCRGLDPAAREEGCLSPYCMPFKFETGTENWAEQYRLFLQSSTTRRLLGAAKSPCEPVLVASTDGDAPPWDRGLPDIADFRRSHWKSCGDRACKPF